MSDLAQCCIISNPALKYSLLGRNDQTLTPGLSLEFGFRPHLSSMCYLPHMLLGGEKRDLAHNPRLPAPYFTGEPALRVGTVSLLTPETCKGHPWPDSLQLLPCVEPALCPPNSSNIILQRE